MMQFKYKALSSSGKTVAGTIEAPTVEAARDLVEARNEIVQVIRPVAQSFRVALAQFKLNHSKVKPEELVLFTRQLATMFRVGIPLLRALDILRDQTEHPTLRKAVADIYTDVARGRSLTEAFRKHPKVFPDIYCSMLAAGEMSGNISEILNRLGEVIAHEAQIKKSVRSALQYPIMVLVALTVAFVVMLTFVIPKFMPIFEGAGVALPLPTRMCVAASDFLRDYGLYLLGGLVAVSFAAKAYFKKETGRMKLDHWLLQAPLIGTVLVRSTMARFANLFAMMQSSGVLVIDIIRILQRCMGNLALKEELEVLEVKLEGGAGIAKPLGEARYFTKMMVNMVAVGEESGDLDGMLSEVALHYDTEVEFAVKKLLGAIGPILTVIMAVAVGFLAFAIYLPMWNMTEVQMNQ